MKNEELMQHIIEANKDRLKRTKTIGKVDKNSRRGKKRLEAKNIAEIDEIKAIIEDYEKCLGE